MGFFTGKVKTDPYGTLNPEQKSLVQKLGPYFNSVVDTSPELYSGQMTAPITAGEQQAVNSSNRLSALSESSLSDLINPDMNVFNNKFNTEVADPTLANWRQNTQPTLEEALPTFSIARGKVVSDALNTVNNNLLTQRYNAWNEAQSRRLNAITGGATAMNQYAQTAAIPRIIQQAGLDKLYGEWSRGQTAKQNSIDQMLNFLGISTVTRTQSPSTLSNINDLLGTANNIVNLGSSFANIGSTQKMLDAYNNRTAAMTYDPYQNADYTNLMTRR